MPKTNLASAIIVAAGKGERFSETKNKVLFHFNGKRIFEYSLETFQKLDLVQEIILVGPSSINVNQLKKKYPKLSHLVPGGEYRQISVLKGMAVTNKENTYVFIHDAARPFFTIQMLTDMLKLIKTCDGVIPLLPVYDAIKEKGENEQLKPVPLKNVFRTQTPQLYKRQILWDAFQDKKTFLNRYRDEMELLKDYKDDVCIQHVKGSYLAEKITTQDELLLLDKLLVKETKTGVGYDFHPFITDRPLILGGIHIPYPFGLEGDSDGDVLIHSILDSLLGALSLGDIGRYIGIKKPNTINASSILFLKKLMQDRTIPVFRIIHLDSTIICKEPLLNPWIENMVECVSKVLKIGNNQINLKSTTDKGVDGAGEGKGIRVISIATIEMFQREG